MRIAVLQMTSGIDPAENAATLTAAIADAAAGGATMIFTPEMTGLLDRDRARAAHHLRNAASDEVLAAACKAASNAGIWVHLGSLALIGERDDGRLVNRGFVIAASGDVRATYDKIHLFDVDLPTGETWRESAVYAAGDQPRIVDTPLGPLGLSICYDIRFPALFQQLSASGATIFAAPAAFTVPTGHAHWHTLLRARAIESGCFLIAAAQTGQHADGRQTFGHSLVVDPWGEVLLDMGEKPGLAFAELDMEKVEQVRGRIPVIKHRRTISAPEVSR